MVNAASVGLVFNGTSYEPSSFVGTTPSYLQARNYSIQEGTSFTPTVAKHSRVVVIGQTVVPTALRRPEPGRPDDQGQRRGLRSHRCAAAKGSNGASDQDDVALAPITTVQDTLTGYGDLDSITVQATSASS